ncbi:MAG: hypothetical protein R3B07_26855 [Polyangiaceae bacterium]
MAQGLGVRGALVIAAMALTLSACARPPKSSAHAPSAPLRQAEPRGSILVVPSSDPSVSREETLPPSRLPIDFRHERFAVRVRPASDSPPCLGRVEDLTSVGFANACAVQSQGSVLIVVVGGGGYDFHWESVSSEIHELTLAWIIENREPVYAPGHRHLLVAVEGILTSGAPDEPGAYVLSVNDTCLPFEVLKRAPRDPVVTCFDPEHPPELRRH